MTEFVGQPAHFHVMMILTHPGVRLKHSEHLSVRTLHTWGQSSGVYTDKYVWDL